MIRVVLDVNVVVSGILSASGPPARLLRMWREGRFELVVSPRLLGELADVLARPKLRGLIDEEEAERLIDLIRVAGMLVPDPVDPERRARDPGDDYVIALSSAADLLVSGDEDILAVEDPPVPVLTPRRFVEEIERG